jgi:hypothetical protein
MSSILRQCSIEPLYADRAPMLKKLARPKRVRPSARKQRVTTKLRPPVYLSGRIAAALMEKVPRCLHSGGPEFRGKLN